MLQPSTIVVWLHDTIETESCTKREVEELRDRAWRAVAGPVHSSMAEAVVERKPPAEAKD